MKTVETLNTAASRPSVCALLTCFNRRDKTLACLAALEANRANADIELHAVLVDDGSTDGTAASVRERFPWVQVVVAEGDLYWCRGMHRAFAHALPQRHDHYLWLNDDTMLDADALVRLLACQAKLGGQTQPLIVIGSTRDSRSGGTTYGGERRQTWWPTSFDKVEPSAEAVRVESFDGNVVLLSQAAALQAGNLDPHFEHAMGDIDYGLRANRAGVVTWLAPGWHGVCDDNPVSGTFLDPALPRRRRWKLMLGRKGVPWRSWWHFNRRHSGLLSPLVFAWPYLRMLSNRETRAGKRFGPEAVDRG